MQIVAAFYFTFHLHFIRRTPLCIAYIINLYSAAQRSKTISPLHTHTWSVSDEDRRRTTHTGEAFPGESKCSFLPASLFTCCFFFGWYIIKYWKDFFLLLLLLTNSHDSLFETRVSFFWGLILFGCVGRVIGNLALVSGTRAVSVLAIKQLTWSGLAYANEPNACKGKLAKTFWNVLKEMIFCSMLAIKQRVMNQVGQRSLILSVQPWKQKWLIQYLFICVTD